VPQALLVEAAPPPYISANVFGMVALCVERIRIDVDNRSGA
jgi:hypothetical protein